MISKIKRLMGKVYPLFILMALCCQQPVYGNFFSKKFNDIQENCPFKVKAPIKDKFYTSAEGIEVKIKKPQFIFRTFKKTDENFLKSLYQDPVLMKTFIVNGQPATEEQFQQLFSYWQHLKRKAPFTAYIIEDKKTKTPIGIFELLPEGENLEISYMIVPHFQGKGWGSQALQIALEDLVPLFREKNILKNFMCFVGYVLEDNFPSLKILEKYGFGENTSIENLRFPKNWKRFEYKIA